MKSTVLTTALFLAFVVNAFAAGTSTSTSKTQNSTTQDIGRGRANTDTNLTDDIRRNQGTDANAPTVRGNENRASNSTRDEKRKRSYQKRSGNQQNTTTDTDSTTRQ